MSFFHVHASPIEFSRSINVWKRCRSFLLCRQSFHHRLFYIVKESLTLFSDTYRNASSIKLNLPFSEDFHRSWSVHWKSSLKGRPCVFYSNRPTACELAALVFQMPSDLNVKRSSLYSQWLSLTPKEWSVCEVCF